MNAPIMKLADRTIQGKEGYLSKEEVAKLTPKLLVERTTALKPLIAAHAREAEETRRPVLSVWEELRKTGIFYHFVPKKFGGLEGNCVDYVEAMLPVAEGDASTAWAAGFSVHHNWLMAHFPEKAQAEMFGKGYGVAPGVVFPPGKVTKVEGGYRVNGRWRWGSGVMNADWILVAGMVEGEPMPPDMLWVAIPADEVTVPDNWDMAGMAATGSADIIVDNVFVPEYRTVRNNDMKNGTSVGAKMHGSDVYRMPMSLFLGMAATIPALGAARSAANHFREYLKGRTAPGQPANKFVDKMASQMRLGEVETKIETATMLVRHVAQRCVDFSKNPPGPDAERIAAKALNSYAVKLCNEAVRTVVEGAGSSAFNNDNPIQRAWRDVQVVSSHVSLDYDGAIELYGRSLLGLPPSTPLY